MTRKPRWTTACPDWAERIVNRESLVPCGALFAESARRAMGVFCSLQVTDLPPKPDGTYPRLGEVVDDRILDLIEAIFGAYDPKIGERLIKEFFLLISKKNGKSTIAAGIMLTALITNWRREQQLLILAPTLEVAKNSFEPARAMVRADPELSTLLKVIDHQRMIRNLKTGAELKIVAADSDVVAGTKAGFVLIEELWQFGKKPKADAMLLEATGGLAARPEGFVLSISTHSDEPPAGVFKERLRYARKVRDGEIEDNSFLPVLYEWPDEMLEAQAYLEPENFDITNPHLGRSVSREWLQANLEKAKESGENALQIFLAKHLNVEFGLRLRSDRWSVADDWMDAADRSITLETLLERSEVVTVGIDGGGREDLFGLSVVGREEGTGVWLIWCHTWCLEMLLDNRRQIAPLLRDFERDGDLTIFKSGHELVEDVARVAVRIKRSGKLPAQQAVGLDMYEIGDLVNALIRKGFDPGDEKRARTGEMVPVRQGVALTSAIHSVEIKINDGRILHDGSAMMAWCISNAIKEQRGDAVYIGKDKTGSSKIDPVVAMLMAIKLMETDPDAGAARSVYETRDLVVL